MRKRWSGCMPLWLRFVLKIEPVHLCSVGCCVNAYSCTPIPVLQAEQIQVKMSMVCEMLDIVH